VPNKKNYPKNFSIYSQPRPPSEPKKTIAKLVDSGDDYKPIYIGLGESLPNDGDDYELIDYGVDGVQIKRSKTWEEVVNPNYDKEFAKYTKDLAAFKAERKVWRDLNKAWRKELEEEKRQSELKQLQILKKKYENIA